MSQPTVPAGRTPRRDGFTLVELMVALMILAVGLLALAGTAGMVVRQVGGGDTMAKAGALAHSRIERIGSLACQPQPANGTRTVGPFTETWTVTGDVVGGQLTALRVDVSVTYNTPRGQRTNTFSSRVPCV